MFIIHTRTAIITTQVDIMVFMRVDDKKQKKKNNTKNQKQKEKIVKLSTNGKNNYEDIHLLIVTNYKMGKYYN